MAKFKEAQRFDEKINIKEYKQKVIPYVEKRLITASKKQAQDGNLETVKAKLDKLEQLNSDNPELDLRLFQGFGTGLRSLICFTIDLLQKSFVI